MKFIAALIWFACALPAFSSSGLTVGVLAPQGAENAMKRWQPLLDRLAMELQMDVTMAPLSAREGIAAFLENDVDLLLGNPVQSAVVADMMQGVAVASVERPSGAQFAGLIVVRDDSRFMSIQDLAGARMASLGDWAAGGYLFQADYLMQAGLAKPSELGERLQGKNQNELVEMVLKGDADAAFIRTGVMEDLLARGIIQPGQLRVLNNKSQEDGGPARTTGWFPEWSIYAQSNVELSVIEAVQQSLYAMTAEDPELETAKVAKFRAPLDNSAVIAAMKRLRVVPYDRE